MEVFLSSARKNLAIEQLLLEVKKQLTFFLCFRGFGFTAIIRIFFLLVRYGFVDSLKMCDLWLIFIWNRIDILSRNFCRKVLSLLFFEQECPRLTIFPKSYENWSKPPISERRRREEQINEYERKKLRIFKRWSILPLHISV